MIDQSQIAKLKAEYKINESVIVREYIQIVFLKELYSEGFSKDIYFKGGTAIRLLFKGIRFSEDLDFTVLTNEAEFEERIQKLFSKLQNQYPFEFKERKTITGKTYLLTAQVPLVSSPVYVKLDFSMRENVLEPTRSILDTQYPVIVQSFINSLSMDEILAEKIRAILKRNKHRDLYDLWVLLEKGAKINLEMIKAKLNYYNETFDAKELLTRIDSFTKENFIKDLRPFVAINEREKLGELFEYVVAYLKKSFSEKV